VVFPEEEGPTGGEGQSKLNLFLSILTSNSTSVKEKQFAAILTPGLAQHPSSL
jgi:hypothetical protein